MIFVFSYNTIFHMYKSYICLAMDEVKRVLKPEGLCFINFLSVDSQTVGKGTEVGKGECLESHDGTETLHSFFEDEEPDPYFAGFEILHKEKRVREWLQGGKKNIRAYIDYIAKKK